MSALGSVTVWINRLRDGDRADVQKLWERYFRRLVGLAHKKLRDVPQAAADAEDVALSAFGSFCRRAEQGQFPRLADRDDLWTVLAVITIRKAYSLIEHEGREKRDWHRVLREDAGARNDGLSEEPLLVRLISHEPEPAFAAEMADQFRWLLAVLADDELRVIAVRKLEGHTNEEIAAQLGCALATIERRLSLIRKSWEGEMPT